MEIRAQFCFATLILHFSIQNLCLASRWLREMIVIEMMVIFWASHNFYHDQRVGKQKPLQIFHWDFWSWWWKIVIHHLFDRYLDVKFNFFRVNECDTSIVLFVYFILNGNLKTVWTFMLIIIIIIKSCCNSIHVYLWTQCICIYFIEPESHTLIVFEAPI